MFGDDRFGTAEDVATTFFPAPTTVGLATSTTFPDALSGGAQLALAGAPLLLLSPQSSVPGPTMTYLTNARGTLSTAHLYGGSTALADSVLAEVRTLVGG